METVGSRPGVMRYYCARSSESEPWKKLARFQVAGVPRENTIVLTLAREHYQAVEEPRGGAATTRRGVTGKRDVRTLTFFFLERPSFLESYLLHHL